MSCEDRRASEFNDYKMYGNLVSYVPLDVER